MSFNLSENVLPRTRSEDDISDYEEVIDNMILNLENEVYNEVLDNKVATRIGCQSPLPSSKFMKYINRDKDNYSVVSDLTEYDKDEDDDDDDEDEEINYKIWPIEYDYDYEEDFAEGYEECYKDDISEANGYYSYCS